MITIKKPFNYFYPVYFAVTLYFGLTELVSWYIILLLFLHDIKLTLNKNSVENINR